MQMLIAPSFISELIRLLAHLINLLKICKPMVHLTMTASQEVIEAIQKLNGFYNHWYANINYTEFHFWTCCITYAFNQSIIYKPMVYLIMATSQEVMKTIQNLSSFCNTQYANVNDTKFYFWTRYITCTLNQLIKNLQTYGLPGNYCISGSNRKHSKFE